MSYEGQIMMVSGGPTAGGFLYFVAMLAAVFVSIRRNGGFHAGSFLMALLFSPLYLLFVVYQMALSKNPVNALNRVRK